MSAAAFDFEPAYRAAGWSDGIAWRAFAFETAPTADTWWDGIEEPTGRVLAHMVGDDRVTAFEPDELSPLDASEYCQECGQVGCGWHVEED